MKQKTIQTLCNKNPISFSEMGFFCLMPDSLVNLTDILPELEQAGVYLIDTFE